MRQSNNFVHVGTHHNKTWKLKGKLKVLTALLFLFSFLFITYQVISYVSLTNYQAEEAAALHQLHNKFKIQREHYSDKLTKHKQDLGPGTGGGHHNHDHDNLAKYYRKTIVSPILGVSVENWKYYSKPSSSLIGSSETNFTCLASGRQISWDKVNDDYCDCPADGSDEPSTNACMNGKFSCTKTIVKFPVSVPSSRVNDNICDCCDGSDEVFTKVHCKKHC